MQFNEDRDDHVNQQINDNIRNVVTIVHPLSTSKQIRLTGLLETLCKLAYTLGKTQGSVEGSELQKVRRALPNKRKTDAKL